MTVNIKHLRLRPLSSLSVEEVFVEDLYGDTLLYSGKLRVDFVIDSIREHMDSLRLDGQFLPETNRIVLRSDVARGFLRANFRDPSIVSRIRTYVRSYIDPTLKIDRAARDSINRNLIFSLKLMRPGILTSGLVPGLRAMRPSTISGTYRSGQQRFFLNALVPKVDYYGVLVDSLNLRSLIGADTFNYRLSFKRMAVFDQLEAINVQLRGQAREDRIINTSIPFGGEFILPFLDFYSVGGPNSLRAFRTREVGPGTRRPNPQQDVFNLLRGKGDIKLEANLEYRWRLGQYLELATFLDAGNVWLFRQRGVGDEEKFEFSDFYKEIALGTGLGIRIDISGLLLRLDFGMPLRKPWRPLGDRWVTDEIDFADPKWRRENLVWNLAFGYPF